MCNFLSAIVLRNGDVLTHPMLDSHLHLIQHFKLPDTREHHQHFAKVELTPTGDWLDVSAWQFRLDEHTAPGWWEDVKASAESTLRARAEKMILKTGEHSLLIDGCWIIGGDAVIRDVRAARIPRVSGGTISDVSGGTISGVRGGTISDVWGGTISDVRGGTISGVSGGTISGVRGGTISGVRGGTISGVSGGTISGVRGGTISGVWGGPWKPLLDDSAKAHVAMKASEKPKAKPRSKAKTAKKAKRV